MKTEIEIDSIVIDNIEEISKQLEIGKNFQLIIYDGTDIDPRVSMWIQQKYKDCTIMFDLTKEQAFFLGKSLVALSKSI